ncbi:MAG: OmpA family protein [Bacteroidia bacterium]|nr:OmpA family protein [Bacteroidia bacterium]
MRAQSGKLFWISYADLMTALFIIVLALFVLSYQMFKVRENDFLNMEEELRLRGLELDEQSLALEKLQVRSLELDQQTVAFNQLKQRLNDEEIHAATLIVQLTDERNRLAVMEEEYKKLREIQRAIENLDSRYFAYQPDYKRHVLRGQVQFAKGESKIAPQYTPMLVESGRALQRLIERLNPDDNINYMLVIEGMASRDAYSRNYELSYERALSLFRLWEKEGLRFDPGRVEVMISGSGEGGMGRDPYNEAKNQRFLIQIIPKIGELKAIEQENDDDRAIVSNWQKK